MLLENTNFIEDKFDYSCGEYVDAMISSWYKKGYEMMFAGASNIVVGNEKDWFLKNCIDQREWKARTSLERYHGVKSILMKKNDIPNLVQFVLKEIEEHNPVSLEVDMNYISCIDAIDKSIDSMNVVVVIGIDSNLQRIYFRIIHGRDKYRDVQSMSFEEMNACVIAVRKYSNEKKELEEFNLNEFLITKAKEFEIINVCGKLVQFSELLEHEIKFENIFGDKENLQLRDIPLVFNAAALYRSRALFSFCLEFLSKRYNKPILKTIANDFMVAAGKYYNIRGVVLKCHYSHKLTRTNLDNIIKYIQLIADIEQNAISKMKIGDSVSDLGYVMGGKRQTINANANNYYVDLQRYFNNKCFSHKVTHEADANFDGIGGYFIDTDYPYDQTISVNDTTSFKIGPYNDSADNIICIGQRIDLRAGRYKKMMIMACSCHGSFKDYVKLVYSYKENERLLIVSSSFWYPKAHFSETIAWQGEYAMYLEDSYYIEQRKLNIYSSYYSISDEDKLEAIILPDCPDIHIFGLSFC